MQIKKMVPNGLTLLNLASGFLSIHFIFDGELVIASILIGLALIFDALDGITARALKVTSKVGVELDSLADATSFVCAPGFMIANYIGGTYGLIIGTAAACFGVYRLAVFNLEGKSDHFQGMPTPFFASIIVSLVLVQDFAVNLKIPGVIFLILAALMVSKIRFPSLKSAELIRYKYRGLVLLVLLILMLIFGVTLQICAIVFITLSLIFVLIPMSISMKDMKYVAVFFLGLVTVIAISYIEPVGFLFHPIIYTVVASPLLEYARGVK